MVRPPPSLPLFPYPTLFRSLRHEPRVHHEIRPFRVRQGAREEPLEQRVPVRRRQHLVQGVGLAAPDRDARSEEHTSELQSQSNLVCRLLLAKKKEWNATHEE